LIALSRHYGNNGGIAMKILKVPEARKMVEAYQRGYITIEELMEDLEWYWDKKIYKGTKTSILDRKSIPMNAIEEG
jgi:hypothetical protein